MISATLALLSVLARLSLCLTTHEKLLAVLGRGSP
jgi:hypothetical protein